MKGPRRLVSKADSGFFFELGIKARLVWRLMGDARVSPFYKLLPLGAFLYLINPLDVIGPLDDAFVIWLGSTLFLELAPPEVVQEHRAKLEPISKPERVDGKINEQDIIDAKYSE